MDSRVTSIVAPGRAESGRGPQSLGPESGSASGRTAVTKADEGVAPTSRGTAHIVTPGSSGGVGTAELTHELVRGQLSEYLDGSLGESDRRRVEGHLASCPPCTAYLDTFRVTVRGLGKLTPPKAPARAYKQILEQARRESDANQ
jgi:hypothetical protein